MSELMSQERSLGSMPRKGAGMDFIHMTSPKVHQLSKAFDVPGVIDAISCGGFSRVSATVRRGEQTGSRT